MLVTSSIQEELAADHDGSKDASSEDEDWSTEEEEE